MVNQEPLNKIGLIIKGARQQRGLSHEELAYQSRVSITHIKNIEAGNRKDLPEEAYLLGYINKILRALNFENPDAVIERYKKEEGSYIVQSIVNSHEPSEGKFGFALTEFKLHHLYTILILALIILAWFTITNYSRNNLSLDQMQAETLAGDTSSSLSGMSASNVVINGLDLHSENGALNNSPTAINRTVSNGVGSKLINIEATSDAWYQLIGVAQRKILYEGNVGPKSAYDHFKFHDEQGFVLATGNAGAFVIDTGNGPFKLGKPNETIKWYFPQTVRRIYKAWGDTVQATKPDPVMVVGLLSGARLEDEVLTLQSFEKTEEKLDVAVEPSTQSSLQEQSLIDVAPANGETSAPIVKKPVPPPVYAAPRPAPVVKQEIKAEMKKRKKQEAKRKREEERKRIERIDED